MDSPVSDSGTQRRKSTKGGGSKPRSQARGSSGGGGGGGRARSGQAARSTPAAQRPRRGSGKQMTYAEDSDDDSDDSEDERPLKLRAGDRQFNGANAVGDSYRGSAGFFAAQGMGGAGRTQPTPWPPPGCWPAFACGGAAPPSACAPTAPPAASAAHQAAHSAAAPPPSAARSHPTSAPAAPATFRLRATFLPTVAAPRRQVNSTRATWEREHGRTCRRRSANA